MVSGAGPPAAPTVFAAASRFDSDDDTSTVCAPSFASATAMPRPMPRLPPVMTATFP